jgi:hypothetical protein
MNINRMIPNNFRLKIQFSKWYHNLYTYLFIQKNQLKILNQVLLRKLQRLMQKRQRKAVVKRLQKAKRKNARS